MPDGHDGVPAVLLGRPGVVDVPRQEVDGEVGGVGEDGLRGSVGVGEVGEGPGLDHALDRLDAAHAPLQVLRLLEVVERHRRVRARVGGPQLDVARGDGAQDLLQDESAPERPPVQPPHRLRRALQGLWGSLLRRQRAQLPRLRREEAEAASQATGALGDGDAELGAAHALDEAAGPGDPDDLHERQRDGHRRRDEHRVHRVVSHALPDHGLVHQHLDAVRLQVRLRADAAQHQQLRAPQRPRRQDHLVLGAVPEVHPVLHPERVREHHTVRHRVRHALLLSEEDPGDGSVEEHGEPPGARVAEEVGGGVALAAAVEDGAPDLGARDVVEGEAVVGRDAGLEQRVAERGLPRGHGGRPSRRRARSRCWPACRTRR
uniref:Uncharacterized protein n=1 Tax=Zea mays TaxID=4577 RepID=C4J5I3_MAIZE|nr:unknown [Zea mays]